MTTRPAILVTGAAKRIGASLAQHFANHGYDIALHYNASETEAKALQKEIAAAGATCALFRLDLNDISGIPKLMDEVAKALPHCTMLINNASVFERATFMETDEALFDRQLTANFKAPFFLTQAFAKKFGKGCVMNILDTDIGRTHGSQFAYLLSKKAFAEFTVMAARELGPNIRVNGICPGYVLPHSAEDAAHIKQAEAALPLENHGAPQDVCEAAFWVSQQPFITGQIMYIDGGKHVL